MKTSSKEEPPSGGRWRHLIFIRCFIAYKFIEHLVAGTRVLDAGCGYGRGTDLLANKAGSVVGLDISIMEISYAKKRFKHDDLNFLWGDVLKLPFKDEAFDAIVSFQVIEHLREPEEYLSEIVRALKPRGLFAISTPNRELRLAPGEKPWEPDHFQEFNSEQLGQLLRRYFEDVTIFGLKASEKAEKAELVRLQSLRSMSILRKMHLYSLRDKIPERMKGFIWGVLSYLMALNVKIRTSEETFQTANSINLSDFQFNEIRLLKKPLDILAICR